ncbi:MAG: hypothetical protein IKQ62_00975 [Bacteroidaceae bacterium]|nr:hypothetical protein [Bacteroidaceae bacterium]
MKKIATILVALMLAWAGITAQAQSTWKQTEREHVVPSVVENNMGDVVRCQLPETIVKGPIKVGLTAGEQAEYIQALWPDGESPRLYAAIFFQRPKETGEALYKKVVGKGDRTLTSTKTKGRNWVEALDVVSQQSGEISYTFTYQDDAQAEFWLVTAIGYGEGYTKGFAWDVLHYMRGGSGKEASEEKNGDSDNGKSRRRGFPPFKEGGDYYYVETISPLERIRGEILPPPEVKESSEADEHSFDTYKMESVIKQYHRKRIEEYEMKDVLLREDRYMLELNHVPYINKSGNTVGVNSYKTIHQTRRGQYGFLLGEELRTDDNRRRHYEWYVQMGIWDLWQHIPKSCIGWSTGNSLWEEGTSNPPLGSISQLKRYGIPVIEKYWEKDVIAGAQARNIYTLETEEFNFKGFPAMRIRRKHTFQTEVLEQYGFDVWDCIYVFLTNFPVATDNYIQGAKDCLKHSGKFEPANLKEEMGESYAVLILSCLSYGIGFHEYRHKMPGIQKQAETKMKEMVAKYEQMIDIVVRHEEKVYEEDEELGGEKELEEQKDSVMEGIKETLGNDSIAITGGGTEEETIGVIDKLLGWLNGDNEILGEHTTATESVVISLIGILLASLVGGVGGGMPIGGGGDIPPAVDPETERLKELDRQQAQQWLKEQRAQNEAQWERERKTGVTETSRRHTEWKQQYLAEEAKKERMRKLEEEFGTTDKATIMEKMKEKQAALEEVARKDKNTAAVWTAITGVTWAIDKGCDVAINVMGEIGGPGAKALKNAYTLAKAPLKRVAEAHVYNKGDEQAMKTAAWQGVTEGLFGVLQNEAGRFSKSLGGWGEMTAVVGGEAAKGALNAYIKGGDMTDIAKEAGQAGVQKAIYYGIGKGVGALSKVKKDADAAPLIKKINDLQIKKLDLLEKGNIKEAVKVMQERGDTMRALGKLGKLSEQLATKNSSQSQEIGAEFGINPVADGTYVDAFSEAANALRSVMNT